MSHYNPNHMSAQTQLKHAYELVCLDVKGNTIITGSRPTVTMLDVRQPQPVLCLTSPEPYQGVRSVQLNGTQLMFGTCVPTLYLAGRSRHVPCNNRGTGKLYFYDVLAQCYINQLDSAASPAAPFHLQTGCGWLDRNTTYRSEGGVLIIAAAAVLQMSVAQKLFPRHGRAACVLCRSMGPRPNPAVCVWRPTGVWAQGLLPGAMELITGRQPPPRRA